MISFLFRSVHSRVHSFHILFDTLNVFFCVYFYALVRSPVFPSFALALCVCVCGVCVYVGGWVHARMCVCVWGGGDV